MEILVLVLTIGLPLVKILLFPAKTIGRGGKWTILGAAMIVGLMMALWFGMQSLTDTSGNLLGGGPTSAADQAATRKAQHDLDSLAQFL